MADLTVENGFVNQPSAGSVGLKTQMGGTATTVDATAGANGIQAGQFIEVDTDSELLAFESDDTPLMALMLSAKGVNVESPVVEHYMIDEEKSSVVTNDATVESANPVALPLDANDINIINQSMTLRAVGVNGYDEDGVNVTVGEDLMLFVVGEDASGNPLVRAVNGKKANRTDAYCLTPIIPAGTTIDILATALHETQREVAPDTSVPTPTTIFLQKRGMNQIVSDYFESQKKRVPFAKAILAERAIRKFKREGNRSLWISRQGKMPVKDAKTGAQMVYFTKGVRWQFKREMQHTGKWTYEQFVALAKMFYTGSDVPEGAICLCGKNFLESIQCIDFSEHPEVKITVETNSLGWSVTRIHTVFGDFDFKREPTLDKIHYSNSAALFGTNRLVHYIRKAESSESERIEGHDATRESVIVWDALALKGTCHLFVNGEGTAVADNAVAYAFHSGATAPTSPVAGTVYYLQDDCAGISATAKAGELWLYNGTSWEEYNGEIEA